MLLQGRNAGLFFFTIVITIGKFSYAQPAGHSTLPTEFTTLAERKSLGIEAEHTSKRETLRGVDANLYDIQFVSSKLGWIVGSSGLILHTADGGTTWENQNSTSTETLRDVCFLSNHIGWAVGEGTQPYTKTRYGVVLFTQNGGKTWKRINSSHLPPLNNVRFFNLQEGIAAGSASLNCSSGVLLTKDGGKTWTPLEGTSNVGWKTAYFHSMKTGVVAGKMGQISLIGGERLIKPQSRQTMLEAFHDVQISHDGLGWLVGDGALVRQTRNHGVSWSDPAGRFPGRFALPPIFSL